MAFSAGGDAVVNPHDLPPRISFAKLLRGGAIRAVAGRRMGAAREGGGRCRRNDDAIPAWYLVTNGTETMRIGRGDIVALRILLGVPVAIGFVFFGILVWAGIDPIVMPRSAGSWPGYVFTGDPLRLPAGGFGLGHGNGAQ